MPTKFEIKEKKSVRSKACAGNTKDKWFKYGPYLDVSVKGDYKGVA